MTSNSGLTLFHANAQWSTRPADERFPNLQALHDACKGYADTAREKNARFDSLRVEAINGDVQLVGKKDIPAQLTHWSFGQLCRLCTWVQADGSRAGTPAEYLRSLPATLACQNLNHGLAHRVKDATASAVATLLFHLNGGYLLRAITSDKYARIWNWEVAERLLDLQGEGWEPAVPDQTWSADQEGVTALYASDHDMFAFLRTSNTLAEPGTDSPIYRGVIVENSEVGASALKLTRFLYRYMCGNHIIWGAEDVEDIAVRHVGSARERWGYYVARVQRYLNSSAKADELKIAQAKTRVIAATKEQVLDALFGKRSLNLSRRTLEAGYDATIPAQDGAPNTQWGLVQGLTRYSQTIPYADQRTQVDRAAGKIMNMEEF